MKHSHKTIPLINVCWLLTTRCNYDCGFCFKVQNKRELYYNEAVKILEKLAKQGVKKISFSGGEPLLWQGTLNLIKHAKSLGMITMLITNGSLLSVKDIQTLENFLDWITLPLDGSNEDNQQLAGRKRNHFSHVIKLLETLSHRQRIKIKINTVLSKKNYKDIVKLIPYIKKYNIERWKIFQFFPIRHNALRNKPEYQVTEKIFLEVKSKVQHDLAQNKTSIYFATNDLIERSYFIIAPDGTVYVSKNGNDYLIGDLKAESVDEIWENNSFINKSKYWDRARWILKNRNK